MVFVVVCAILERHNLKRSQMFLSSCGPKYIYTSRCKQGIERNKGGNSLTGGLCRTVIRLWSKGSNCILFYFSEGGVVYLYLSSVCVNLFCEHCMLDPHISIYRSIQRGRTPALSMNTYKTLNQKIKPLKNLGPAPLLFMKKEKKQRSENEKEIKR